MAKLPQADRRAHILNAAGKVFLEQGFAGASMNDIAKAGAGSKGTLYTYFDSKEQMFEAFMISEIELRAKLTFELPDHAEDPVQVLKALGVRYIKLITHPTVSSLLRVVIAEAVRFPTIGKIFNEAGPKAAQVKLDSFIQRCVDDGRLVVEDTRLATNQFMRLCQAGIMQEFLFGLRPAPSAAEIDHAVDAAVTMFMNSYAPGRSA